MIVDFIFHSLTNQNIDFSFSFVTHLFADGLGQNLKLLKWINGVWTSDICYVSPVDGGAVIILN